MESDGYLEIILGPMFSGKTTLLIQHYKKFSYIGKNVAVVNYVDDVRYHESLLSTHDKIMIPCIFAKTLQELCGLDGDFQRNKFGKLLDLIPYANNVTKLNSLCALCKNGKAGLFSHRISSETSQVVIGSDNYKPVCRLCYQKNTK